MRGRAWKNYCRLELSHLPTGCGEAKVFPTTDDKERFRDLKEVLLRGKKGDQLLHIVSVKFFQEYGDPEVSEFTTPEEIDGIRQADFVTREQAVPLEEDEYFIADLIGIEVYTDDGEAFGTISDVLSTGANDVYVVDSPAHGQVLLPAIKDCVRQIDVKGRRMEIHLMPGLV